MPCLALSTTHFLGFIEIIIVVIKHKAPCHPILTCQLSYFPGMLQVYGTVFHMNQGNPFKLKALVDKWPDFNTVVVRPQEQEMTDDLDHYTNTYQIYSKDPNNCLKFLDPPEVINWKQHLQIQSKRPGINQELFKPSSLDVTHAALVNKFWLFGGNERSQRLIERCIRTFPTYCLLGPEGTPVSWALRDQTGETRMVGAVPEYRKQGLTHHVVYHYAQVLLKLGLPTYFHTDKSNKAVQELSHKLNHRIMPCTWNQGNCVPL
ncbi:glycine N-acyltransferase-like [Loxodonta africana]|uniref:glycine N-acyltransferase-like n=1 Tax=Loxodonta africana TaxID=9785 RepID=UPI0030CC1280